jgi:hypothetical protein
VSNNYSRASSSSTGSISATSYAHHAPRTVVNFSEAEVAACILSGRGEQHRIIRRLAKKYGLPTTRVAAEAALADGTASASLVQAASA